MIKSLDTSEFDRVWAMYSHIHDIEDRFNRLQLSCKLLASSWALGMFVAVGFVLNADIAWPVPVMIVIASLSVFTFLGLFVIGHLDLYVYQKLLEAAFGEARRLEEEYGWLPKVRTSMVRAMPHGSASLLLRVFYIMVAAVPLVIAAVALAWEFSRWESY